jgi:branched-chain amino acid transport system substrate-binding protein
MRKSVGVGAVVLAATLVATACSSSPSKGTTAGPTAAGTSQGGGGGGGGGSKTFVLGVDAPLTGGNAASGVQIKNAVTLAFDQIDNKIGDYTIKLVYIDDKADPAAGATALQSAISGQHVQAVIGNWNSAVSITQMDVAARNKIPFFFSGGTAGTIDEKYKSDPKKYSYWLGKAFPPTDKDGALYGPALDEWYKANPSGFCCGKTVAVLAEDTDFGRGYADGAVDALKKLGWDVKGQDFFAIDSTNHLTTLEKDKGVSVLFGTGTSLQAIGALVNQANQIKMKSLIIANGLGYSDKWYSLTGAASNGVVDQESVPSGAKAKEFADAFKAKFGIDSVASTSGTFYDYARFLQLIMNQALKEHGELTSDSLYQVGYNEVRTGKLVYEDGYIYPGLKYSEETWPAPVDSPTTYHLQIVQYDNGKPVVVYPEAEATGKFKYPAS